MPAAAKGFASKRILGWRLVLGCEPFSGDGRNKKMVLDNICYLLNNFIHCSAYENIILGWVMHEQSIIDAILKRLDTENCIVNCISLLVDEKTSIADLREILLQKSGNRRL